MLIKFARIGTPGDIDGGTIFEPVLGTSVEAFKERGAAEIADGVGLRSVSQETLFVDPNQNKIGSLRQILVDYGEFIGQIVSIEHKIGNKLKTAVTILRK